MNLIIPESYKQIIASALGFSTFEAAISAVEKMEFNEFGYAEIRKNGAFIQKTQNKRSYASVICGGGKCGMSKDWAAGAKYLTQRGVLISKGFAA